MARPYRLKFDHACYLVTLKGVEGIGLFVENSDAEHFVELLDLIARKHQVLLHAYALAENTASLVLETPHANVSLYLQGVQTAFARHIRQHYVQSGPIMKDRYRAKLIEKSTVLGPACEWVHTLPARELDSSPASQLKCFRGALYSSYRHTVGEVEQGINSPDDLLRTYGSPVKKRIPAHIAACESMVKEGAESWERLMKKSTIAIGSEEFVKEMEQKHRALVAGKRVKGVRSYGKKPQGISRNKIMEQVAKSFNASNQDFFVQKHGSVLRPVLSTFLYQHSLMTQKEIAEYLKLGSAAAVSLQIKQLLTLRQQEPELDKKCRKLEKSFAQG